MKKCKYSHHEILQSLMLYGVILSAIGFGLYLILTIQAPDMCMDNEGVISAFNGWRVKYREEEQEASLPIQVPVSKEETVWYSRVLEDSGIFYNTVMVLVKQQYVKFYLDGKVFYEYGYDNRTPIGNSPFYGWAIVRLPEGYAGKKLTIEQTAYYEKYAGSLEEVYLGTKNALVFKLFRKSIPKILLNFAILLLSIFLFYSSFFFHRREMMAQLRYLSLFSFFTSIWLGLETGGNQLIFSSLPFIYGLINLILSLLPILCIRFILTYSTFSGNCYMNSLFWISVMNFFVIHIVQLIGLVDYFYSIITIHILVVLIIGGVWGKFIRGLMKKEKIRNKSLYVSFFLFSSFIWIDIIRFYQGGNDKSPAIFSQIGMMSFILTLSAFAIYKIARDNENALKQEVLQQMAYVDLLTGIPNRNAFEQEIEYYRLHPDLYPIVMVADLNYLKVINDTFGHKVGDQAIIAVAKALQTNFVGQKIFRIGGDEFCVFSDKLEEGEFAVKVRDLCREIERVAKEEQKPFSVACGWLRGNEEGIDWTFTQADTKMYQNKERMKQMNHFEFLKDNK